MEKILWSLCEIVIKIKVIQYIINKLPETYKFTDLYQVIHLLPINNTMDIACVTKFIKILRYNQICLNKSNKKNDIDKHNEYIKSALINICKNETTHLIDVFMQTLLVKEDIIKDAYSNHSTYKVKQALHKYLYLQNR